MAGGLGVTHRKLLAVGLIGSSIEWYDFFLYSTAAALAFPKIFFPNVTPLTGTLLAFSTFWAGFLARPIGGVIAGHFGDRYGRKPVVAFCLWLMTASTFLIGCLPGAAAVGALAPVLLVTLRFIQGLACGGQWGGIVLLLTESTGPKRRGFAGTFGLMSVPFGSMLGTLVFLAATAALSNEQFLSWGWRIPFFCSVLMAPVVLYIQRKVEDTPEFRALAEQADAKATQRRIAEAPLADVIKSSWRRILLGAGLLAGTNALFYISTAGLLSYGTVALGMSRDGLLICSLLSSVATFGFICWSGHLSDRFGRRMPIVLGGLGVLIWAFPYFWLINTASLVLVFFSVAIAAVFQSILYGPLAAYLAELFAPNVRYSGVSMAYQLAAITISGGTPALTTFLIASTGSTALVSVYIALSAVVTVLCAWKLPETNPASVRADPAAVPGSQLTSAAS
jgi:MFS family permease